MPHHRAFVLACLLFSFNLFALPAGAATGTVMSTLDASGYTYVEADTGSEKIWLAGPKTSLTQGSTIELDTNNPMHNFHSKSLNRDFPVIYFVDNFSGNAVLTASTSAVTEDSKAKPAMQAPSAQPAELMQPIKPAKGGHTIAGIIASKKELADKVVTVRGQVTKFNANIMNKNWLHIIDGSHDNDLTIITNDIAEVGQTVVIEGTVVLDKDFGYGYFYELLIDNAKITVE